MVMFSVIGQGEDLHWYAMRGIGELWRSKEATPFAPTSIDSYTCVAQPTQWSWKGDGIYGRLSFKYPQTPSPQEIAASPMLRPAEPLPKGYDAPDGVLPILTICERCGTIKTLTHIEEQRLLALGFAWCTCNAYSAEKVNVGTKADIYYNRMWKKEEQA